MDFTNPFGGTYGGESSVPQELHDGHSEPFSRRPSQQQFMEEYLHQHGHYEPNDYHRSHIGPEDFEDCEILTRPRLTKEQVEVLENQFQAHPKPNSNVKRQLAIQTNLPLPRVSVRFIAVSPLLVLINMAELVPKSKSKGQTIEEAGRVRVTAGHGPD